MEASGSMQEGQGDAPEPRPRRGRGDTSSTLGANYKHPIGLLTNLPTERRNQHFKWRWGPFYLHLIFSSRGSGSDPGRVRWPFGGLLRALMGLQVSCVTGPAQVMRKEMLGLSKQTMIEIVSCPFLFLVFAMIVNARTLR